MKVVVVGAGIAGLTSARALAELGYRVTIVEASERVGGRIMSKRVEVTTCNNASLQNEHDHAHQQTRYNALTLNTNELLGACGRGRCRWTVTGEYWSLQWRDILQ